MLLIQRLNIGFVTFVIFLVANLVVITVQITALSRTAHSVLYCCIAVCIQRNITYHMIV